MQMDTLQVVMAYIDALKSCLTWKPSPVQEMKSMQTGKNVRELGECDCSIHCVQRRFLRLRNYYVIIALHVQMNNLWK